MKIYARKFCPENKLVYWFLEKLSIIHLTVRNKKDMDVFYFCLKCGSTSHKFPKGSFSIRLFVRFVDSWFGITLWVTSRVGINYIRNCSHCGLLIRWIFISLLLNDWADEEWRKEMNWSFWFIAFSPGEAEKAEEWDNTVNRNYSKIRTPPLNLQFIHPQFHGVVQLKDIVTDNIILSERHINYYPNW